MNYKTKRGVLLFLDNFILPLQDQKLHYQKLNYGIKHFKQIEYPGLTAKPSLKTTQFQIQQEINKQLYNKNKLKTNDFSKNFYQDTQTPKPQTLDIPSKRSNGNNPSSQFSTFKKAVLNADQDEQIHNTRQEKKYPEYQVIAMVKHIIPPFPKANQPKYYNNNNKEQFYYNIGTTVDINKTLQNNYQIIPNSLTPFVKIKNIKKNEFEQNIKQTLKLDNFYRPPHAMSVENLDFMVYNGVKVFMCEYEELQIKQETISYLRQNRLQIQNKLQEIAEKIGFQLQDFLTQKNQEFIQNHQEFILESMKFSDEIEKISQKDELLIKLLLQQIYSILIHIDQKFFNKSISTEWVETKYKFIQSHPEQQLLTLNKFANTLKC